MEFEEINLVIPCLEMAHDGGYADLQAPQVRPQAVRTCAYLPAAACGQASQHCAQCGARHPTPPTPHSPGRRAATKRTSTTTRRPRGPANTCSSAAVRHTHQRAWRQRCSAAWVGAHPPVAAGGALSAAICALCLSILPAPQTRWRRRPASTTFSRAGCLRRTAQRASRWQSLCTIFSRGGASRPPPCRTPACGTRSRRGGRTGGWLR